MRRFEGNAWLKRRMGGAFVLQFDSQAGLRMDWEWNLIDPVLWSDKGPLPALLWGEMSITWIEELPP